MSKLSDQATEIFNAGVDAVRAQPLVRRTLEVDASQLRIGEHVWNRDRFDRLILVGGGKAGTAMAQGFLEAVGDWLPVIGWINVPEGTLPQDGQPGPTLAGIHLHPARPAGVNEPTAEGVAGTLEILKLVSQAGPQDLCIALISGGGSALLPAPVDGITLDDKLLVTRRLSAGGADITELNVVRKHLSRIKGGGLLRACRAGHLITLVLSDVLGDPLDVIASGPTVPDTSTTADAMAVLRRFDPDRTLPRRIYDVLEKIRNDAADSSSLVPSTTIVIGNNALAVDEAGLRAEQLGYNHAMQSAARCEGAAEEVGRTIAEMTVGMLRPEPGEHRIDCLITGGEPTVTLAPPDQRGRGGRNQQLVLAAYQHLLAVGLSPAEWNRLCVLSGGTDGEDGPTDAAGAFLDGAVHQRASQLELDLSDYLRRNDAYTFFQQAGGLIKTGPTGTNVCDLRVAVVGRDAGSGG